MELPPWLSTAHLGNALLIFILILYLNYFDGLSKKPEIILSEYRWIFGTLMFLFFAQSVYGGYVRHSGAGLGCPDFPRCLGYWIPPLLSGITWIHFLHRVFAVGILAVSLGFLLFVRWHPELRAFYRPIIFITLLFTVQIVTGIFVVITQLYFVLAAIHLALALIILMLISNIIFRAKEFGMT
jgi:cytochrome c oxidase assembly protein subunit 15